MTDDRLSSVIQAGKHFDRAVEAALARNDAAFASEMQAFNAIKETWKPKEANHGRS